MGPKKDTREEQTKRITQETFDAVVTENRDEFGMETEEAIADAIEQFEAQGVDLSNIVTTVPQASEGPAGEEAGDGKRVFGDNGRVGCQKPPSDVIENEKGVLLFSFLPLF
jgi:hypothetical protein